MTKSMSWPIIPLYFITWDSSSKQDKNEVSALNVATFTFTSESASECWNSCIKFYWFSTICCWGRWYSDNNSKTYMANCLAFTTPSCWAGGYCAKTITYWTSSPYDSSLLWSLQMISALRLNKLSGSYSKLIESLKTFLSVAACSTVICSSSFSSALSSR